MSRIDELIQELCPDGVEYVDLGSAVRIRNGSDYKALGAGDVPVYGSGGVMTSVDTPVYDGPSVLIPRKGSLGNLFYVDEPFWTVDTIFYTEIDASRLIPKFFYYVMFTQRLAEKNQAGGVPSMTQSYLKRLMIPIPPLEVQREIVRVLDKFTQLEAELEAELEARRGQYDYYAGKLLTIDEGVRRVRIGDVATIVRGASPRPIQKFITDDPEGVPWIKIGDAPADGKYITSTAQRVTLEGAAKSRLVLPGDFVLSNSMSLVVPMSHGLRDASMTAGWRSAPSRTRLSATISTTCCAPHLYRKSSRAGPVLARSRT